MPGLKVIPGSSLERLINSHKNRRIATVFNKLAAGNKQFDSATIKKLFLEDDFISKFRQELEKASTESIDEDTKKSWTEALSRFQKYINSNLLKYIKNEMFRNTSP